MTKIIYDDYSRIIINSSTSSATALDEKNTRIILIIDKWINNFYKKNWYLRHIRFWVKKSGNFISVCPSPITDFIFPGTEFLLTFYKLKSKTRGQNKVPDSGSWAQQGNWDNIKGDKQENKAGYPIELPYRFILLYSLKNEIVFDPFLGNGTTLIACEKTNRICYGIEISPHYCDVIVNRYIKWMTENNRQINIKLNGKKYAI